MMMNLMQLLQERADCQRDQLAIIGPGDETLTYGQLEKEIRAISRKLKAAKVQPRQCVGLHLPSGRDYILLSYAIWDCGACVVPIPVELTPGEKAEICTSIGMSHVVSEPLTVATVEKFRSGSTISISGQSVVFPVDAPKQHPPGFHDVNAAFIRFSSGTTGTSKGVVLSHQSIYDRICAANEVLKIGPDDRIIWLLSMSYHFAVSIVSYLSFGATIVLPANEFAVGIIGATAKYQGTLVYGSPLHFLQMSKNRSGIMLPSLRLAISTTTGLSREIGESFYERFKVPLTQAYGIIEVGLPCINLQWAVDRCDAVGNVLPAYEVKLEECGNERGLKEIKIRGKGVLDAYYDPWKTRGEIMVDGWFRTGDLGELDEDGCLHIRGRAKEMISVSGMKLFPQEVENVLKLHEAVSEASVFAHPHRRLGEVPHAHVVLLENASSSPTPEELRNHCRKQLAAYKVPEKIVFVEQLLRTASGKIIRREMEVAHH